MVAGALAVRRARRAIFELRGAIRVLTAGALSVAFPIVSTARRAVVEAIVLRVGAGARGAALAVARSASQFGRAGSARTVARALAADASYTMARATLSIFAAGCTIRRGVIVGDAAVELAAAARLFSGIAFPIAAAQPFERSQRAS